jgi:threonine/homoserine/homoserine lactone efflux protein
MLLEEAFRKGKKPESHQLLGIGTGTIVHTIAASLGLSAILMASAAVFEIIKYIGAAYLFYLGIQMIFRKYKPDEKISSDENELNLFAIYKKGILTNILNPKVALFFLAFLPQFVNPLNEFGALPFVILGLTFVTTGTVWCMIVAIFSSAFSKRLRKDLFIKKLLEKLCGILFIGIGIRLALQKQ